MSVEDLLLEIEAAFDGVQLGDGISIREAREIDYHGGREKRLQAREKDKEPSWKGVPLEVLKRNEPYLCFLDAEGTRFYLPAYMSWYLKTDGEVGSDDLFGPLSFGDTCGDPFTLLSERQFKVVKAFLEYALEHDEYNEDEIKKALEGYWSKYD